MKHTKKAKEFTKEKRYWKGRSCSKVHLASSARYCLFKIATSHSPYICLSSKHTCIYVQMTIPTMSKSRKNSVYPILHTLKWRLIKKKGIWNFSHGSTHQRHANYCVNNWTNCYFQKHYNMQYCNAEQCRIVPSDEQVQQLLFTSVGLQEEPKPEIPMCYLR